MKNILVVLLFASACLAQTVGGSPGAGTATGIRRGPMRPATCRVGDVWEDTSTSPAVPYWCNTKDVWTADAAGGGGGGISGGVTGTLPVFTSPTTIGNSTIVDTPGVDTVTSNPCIGVNSTDFFCLTGSNSTLSMFSGSIVSSAGQVVYSSGGGTSHSDLAGHVRIGGQFEISSIPNETATGTTLNKLAKLTGAPSKAIITATTDTSGIQGIVTGGPGITGNAAISVLGFPSCTFDGATTAGDYVQNSPTVAGDCHDAGATYPTTGDVIGQVITTNGGAGLATVDMRSGVVPAASAGGGSGTVTHTAGALTLNAVILGNGSADSKAGAVLPSDATKFYDGTGTFSVPAGGGGGGSIYPAFTAPPLAAAFTCNTCTGVSLVDDAVTGSLIVRATPASGVYHALGQIASLPATPWTFDACIIGAQNLLLSSGPVNDGIGVFPAAVTPSSVGVSIDIVGQSNVNLDSPQFRILSWTDTATSNATVPAGPVAIKSIDMQCMRMTNDGANINSYLSVGSKHWAKAISSFATISSAHTALMFQWSATDMQEAVWMVKHFAVAGAICTEDQNITGPGGASWAVGTCTN